MSLLPLTFLEAIARVSVTYSDRDSNKEVHLDDIVIRPNNILRDSALTIRYKVSTDSNDNVILSWLLLPLRPIELVHFESKYSMVLDGQRMLANGFQSWSETRELQAEDRILPLRSSVAWYTQVNNQGDYDIITHSGDKGKIHSSSFTHFRDGHDSVCFFGSLANDTGYTYFKGDFNTNTLSVYKDILGKHLDAREEIVLDKVLVSRGNLATIWDQYNLLLTGKPIMNPSSPACQAKHVTGWTSWYNYYDTISEADVYANLDALKNRYPIDIFQIDDGFQTAIGDWLSLNEKFPSGMPVMVEKIHDAGFKAGIWLSPYAVGFKSQLARDHPDWLIRDPKTDKPVVAGPNWDGYYGLDLYHPEARAYIEKVMQVALHEWKFDMVKLDFLFATAIIPRLGKTRGEIMSDAMTFIRDLVGPDKLILGCGVPLASAWHKVDYCRIGADVAPWWEDSALKLLNVRERVSTVSSLASTLSRWTMSGRMFGNDPDVMFIRTKKNKLTFEERYSLCVINNILGSLIFVSDNVAEYDEDEHSLYSATFPKVQPHVDDVEETPRNVYTIQYSANQHRYTTFVNLSSDAQVISCPAATQDTRFFFATRHATHLAKDHAATPLLYFPGAALHLHRHETVTLVHVNLPGPDDVVLCGTTSHIVPGTEVASLSFKDGRLDATFSSKNRRPRRVYVIVGSNIQLKDTRILETRMDTPDEQESLRVSIHTVDFGLDA